MSPFDPGFQKPLALLLLRDRRRGSEPWRESSSCSNQKWHDVNKHADYSAHLFCAMQLMSFIIQKTLWKPNNHSLSFGLMRVIEWAPAAGESGLTSAHRRWNVCVPTSAVLPLHHLSPLNCPNLFKLSLMTDLRYTGPKPTRVSYAQLSERRKRKEKKKK